MKERILFLVLLCFLIFQNFVVADLQENIDENIQKIETTKTNIENLQEINESYLGEEFKKILLTNPIISLIDLSLKEISIFFEILLGMPYSFSIGFLFIVFIWVYLLRTLSYPLNIFSGNKIGWIISFVVLLILARLNFFDKVLGISRKILVSLTEFIKISFLPIIILVFVIGIFLYIFESFTAWLINWYSKKIKEFDEDKIKIDKMLLHSTIEGMYKVFTGETRVLHHQ